MEKTKNAKRIVVKVGSSTLTKDGGVLNLRRIEKICMVLSDIKNGGRDVVLVSSGAVSAGRGKLKVGHRPATLEEKQALAAVGQGELMMIYERFFSLYGNTVGQILLTWDVVDSPVSRRNAENTLSKLFEMGVIPIVNENDTVASEEFRFGDNDTLSAHVSLLAKADLLINLSDTDGFYDSDPRHDPNAKLLKYVEKIDERMYGYAKDSSTDVGTGGMTSKIKAAEIACSHGIPMMIVSGEDPEILYRIIEDGEDDGTYFAAYDGGK